MFFMGKVRFMQMSLAINNFIEPIIWFDSRKSGRYKLPVKYSYSGTLPSPPDN